MNADLEKTLDELGTDYRSVVDRLRAGRTVEPSAVRSRTLRPFEPIRPSWTGRAVALVAASLFVAIVLSIFCGRPDGPSAGDSVYTVAYAPTEEALTAIVASQRADGSWANDYLTRQNAAALKAALEPAARVAYRKAVRYLRTRGLAPLTQEELRGREDRAIAWKTSRNA